MHGTLRFTRPLGLAALLSLPLLAAAAPLTGTVTNRTTNKPSAGDTVTLLKLTTSMEEVVSTTTDARGHFSLNVTDDGMHLVRVTHEKATYFAPAPPNTHNVTVDVYEAAEQVKGVSTAVQELHVEATADKLQVVEILQVVDQSQPAMTQFGPKGFDFFLPPSAHIVRTVAMRDQLPVPASATPVGDPGHYTFLYPIRPGETQFGIFYDLPYTGSATIPLHLPRSVATVAVVVPSGMKFTSGRGANFAPQAATPDSPGAQTWTASQIAADTTLEFSVSGTGSLQAPSSSGPTGAGAPAGADQTQAAPVDTRPGGGLGNPLDPDGTRDPWGKYKGWIIAGFILLLAAGAAFLLRAPAAAATPIPSAPAPSGPDHGPLAALKEELFALEADRLQQRISEPDYQAHRAALDLVLRRALTRTAPPAAAPAATSAPPNTPGAS